MTINSSVRVFVILLAVLTALSCSKKDDDKSPPPSTIDYPVKLEFSGFGTHGFFDPSLTFDPTTNKLWMSYSSVEESALWPSQNDHAVTTRLAYSENGGESWIDSGAIVNNYQDVTLAATAPNDAGTWHNEVSSIIYDPGTVVGERWKLFWHHYLLIDGNRTFASGWIGYKAASTPEGLAGATEQKLFVGLGYDADNNVQGNANTQSPLGGAPLQLDTLHADLNSCIAFTEIGTYATASALYLTLLCPTLGGDNLAFVFKCTSPCNVSNIGSYTYLGTSLNDAIATGLGYVNFSGNDIIAANGKTYLMVSPVSNTPFPDAYNGCFVYEFANIETGALVGGATPTLIKDVQGTPGSFNGACGYDAMATSGGFVYSEAITGPPTVFQLFLSGETL